MKNFIIALTLVFSTFLAGCLGQDNTPRGQPTKAAKEAADSINFIGNAEVDNIKRRLTLTSNPDLLGFILILNQAGQPILYEAVKGKITSGTKRLNAPDRTKCGGNNCFNTSAASDEGTYGASSDYVYYFNTSGQYRQFHNVGYLYSDAPFRLTIEPLAVSLQPSTKDEKLPSKKLP
jgi:hypothetical protein